MPFEKDDKVEVYFIHPGQHEPLWHKGVVVRAMPDSAAYEVLAGSVKTVAAPANIRKA